MLGQPGSQLRAYRTGGSACGSGAGDALAESLALVDLLAPGSAQ
jgi:hypothetical protein